MDYYKQKEYWIEASIDDLNSAENIFNAGNYDWSLFIAHLLLEKILKAYYVKERNEVPSKIHKLEKIAELSELQLGDNQIEMLRLVNEFNLQARYPDYKKKFKTICTKEFTNEYLLKIKVMHQWIFEKLKE